MTVLYERRAFCRYLCPLAGWLGAYSALSPLEIRGNKKVCQTQCGEHTCYKGTDAVPGCPMFLYPAAMNSNAECLLCTNCVKSCENRGVQLNLRPPLVELWRNSAPTVALAVFAFVLLGVMSSHWITKLPFWKAVKANPPLPLTVVELALFFGCIIVGVISPDDGLDAALGGGVAREADGEHGALRGRVHPARVRRARLADAEGAAEHRPPDDVGLGPRPRLQPGTGGGCATAAVAAPGDLFDPAVVAFVQGLTIIGGIVGSIIAIVFVARRAEKIGRHGAGAAAPAARLRARPRPHVLPARPRGEAEAGEPPTSERRLRPRSPSRPKPRRRLPRRPNAPPPGAKPVPK